MTDCCQVVIASGGDKLLEIFIHQGLKGSVTSKDTWQFICLLILFSTRG